MFLRLNGGWPILVALLLFATGVWDKGSGEGGGLAMNDGVITCISVLRSVIQYLDNEKLIHLDNEDLFEVLQKYAVALGEYLGGFSEQERKGFRDLRGIQGQTRRRRNCEQAIRKVISAFNPPGLDQFIQQEKANTNIKGKEIIDHIERTLQKVVLEELRRECGDEESGWWMTGVPKSVRVKVSERFEEDAGKRGGRENYFDLIDYAKIAVQNWPLFEPLFGARKDGEEGRPDSLAQRCERETKHCLAPFGSYHTNNRGFVNSGGVRPLAFRKDTVGNPLYSRR